MFKRIGLFLLTNIAVIAIITLVIFIVEKVFHIQVSGGPGSSYTSILIYAAIVGMSGSFFSLLISRWIAKRTYKISLIKKGEIDHLKDKEKIVWYLVEDLAERNNIKMPEVGIYQDDEPNAFATGSSKNSSLIAVSTGLLDTMDGDAIEGVVAHEMAHVLNGDMVTMALLQGVVNTFVIFAARILANIFDNATDGKFGFLGYVAINIVLQIIFGILASLITMKFSRYREFKADAGSARFVGKDKMIAGLRALQNMKDKMHKTDPQTASMQIATKEKSGIMQLFSSHPDLEKRIQALEEMKI